MLLYIGAGRITAHSVMGTKVEWLDPPPNSLPSTFFAPKEGDEQCGFFELMLLEEEDTGTQIM